jgi:hypothetical protein
MRYLENELLVPELFLIFLPLAILLLCLYALLGAKRIWFYVFIGLSLVRALPSRSSLN